MHATHTLRVVARRMYHRKGCSYPSSRFVREFSQHPEWLQDFWSLSMADGPIGPGQLVSAFEYAPLQDPARHIRLLKILPEVYPGVQSVSMVAVPLSEAPNYAAISYTWGEPPADEPIDVDGRRMFVGKNCRHVLWQLQYHDLFEYYWIDAICINQSDVGEKGPQVQMMGDIYRMSKCVLACFGEHDDDSNTLFARLRGLEFALGASNEKDQKVSYARGLTSRRPDYTWLGSLKTVALSDLCKALKTFSERDYWTRVWIVQELRLAPSAKILCGDDIVPYDVLLVMCEEVEACGEYAHAREYTNTKPPKPSPPCHTPDDHPAFGHSSDAFRFPLIKRYACGEFGNLPAMLRESRPLKCGDKRDYIYGFLELIKWPGQQSPIKSDYSISPLQLAKIALRYYEPGSWGRDHLSYPAGPFCFAARILEGLKLDCLDADIAALHAHRRASYTAQGRARVLSTKGVSSNHASETQQGWPETNSPTSPSSNEKHEGVDSDLRDRSRMYYYRARGPSYQLQDHGNGSLQAPISVRFVKRADAPDFEGPHSVGFNKEERKWREYYRLVDEVGPHLAPRRIMHDGQLAAIACSAARAGDFLVDLGTREGGAVWLIVRESTGDRYRIVGHARLAIAYALCNFGNHCRCFLGHAPPVVDWDFYFEEEDLLALVQIKPLGSRSSTGPNFTGGNPIARLTSSVTRESFSSYAVAVAKAQDLNADDRKPALRVRTLNLKTCAGCHKLVPYGGRYNSGEARGTLPHFCVSCYGSDFDRFIDEKGSVSIQDIAEIRGRIGS